MQVSQNGVNLVGGFEGFSAKAYPDPKTGAKPYTIGNGTTVYPSGAPVRLGDTCTVAQAASWLANDLKGAEATVNKLVKVPLNQNQFDALCSFVYNLGATNFSGSTLLKMLNAKNYAGAADQFMRWVSPGTSVEKGLTRRRAAERALFLS